MTFEYEYPPTLYPGRNEPLDKNQYEKYAEQTVNGHGVWRGFRFGRYELNIDLCRSPQYSHVVQFRAQVEEPAQAADMITMALTLLAADRPQREGCVSID